MQLGLRHVCRFFLHLVGVRESGPPVDDVCGDGCKVVSDFSRSITS